MWVARTSESRLVSTATSIPIATQAPGAPQPEDGGKEEGHGERKRASPEVVRPAAERPLRHVRGSARVVQLVSSAHARGEPLRSGSTAASAGAR